MSRQEDLELAGRLARLGGDHALSLFRQAGLQAGHKRFHGDWVTRADQEAEALIRKELAQVQPEDSILGEEEGGQDGGEGRCWIIDPVDGTSNFVHGLPTWCTAVALLEDGQATVTAVYSPTSDELWSASLGAGAHLNGQPVQVRDEEKISGSLCYCVTSGKSRGEHFNVNAVLMEMTMAGVRPRLLGSGSLRAALLASGHLQGWLQPMPPAWDWHPGQLLMREAGAAHRELDCPPGWQLFCPPGLLDEFTEMAARITPRYP